MDSFLLRKLRLRRGEKPARATQSFCSLSETGLEIAACVHTPPVLPCGLGNCLAVLTFILMFVQKSFEGRKCDLPSPHPEPGLCVCVRMLSANLCVHFTYSCVFIHVCACLREGVCVDLGSGMRVVICVCVTRVDVHESRYGSV